MPRINPAVDANAIPQDLRDLPRWCCWKETPSAGNKKAGKPPIDAKSGRYASIRESGTWSSFEQALTYLRESLDQGPPAGLNFVLNGDGIVGLDLDGCRNVGTKMIDAWALEIVKRFGSYTEISPSGTGLRIFLRGKLPAAGRHKGGIEVYDSKKFLSVTGRKLTGHGAGDGIADRSAELLAWHREVFGHRSASSTKESNGQVVVNDPPDVDQDRLNGLFQAKPKAKAAFEGGGGYPSQSERDLALANFATAAGWTRKRPPICWSWAA